VTHFIRAAAKVAGPFIREVFRKAGPEIVMTIMTTVIVVAAGRPVKAPATR
jgi:hypothetical protein